MSFKNYKRSIVLDFNYEQVKKGVPEANKQMALLNSEFRRHSEEIAESGTRLEKLSAQQELYANRVQIQADKVEILRSELDKLSNADEKNSKAITNKTIDLKNAETQLMKYEKALEEVNGELGRQENVFTKAADNLDAYTKKLEANGTKLEDVGKGLSTLGAGMTAAITVPLVALGTMGVKAYAEFETAFAGVRKTVDATEEEFAQLEKGIRDMSKEIPVTAIEIARAAEAAGQLGIAKENILSFTRTMVDLGVATNMSSDEAATALAQLANITQMNQQDFDRLGSTIVALGNTLATTESKIVDMGLRLAGAGAQVGLTEAQILGFAGALSSVGIEAEAGGSAFSKVFVEMQLAVERGGDELRNFAKVSGMSGGMFKKAFADDAAGAMISFIEGLGRMQNQGKSAIGVLDNMGITEVRMRDSLLRAANAGDLFTDSIQKGTDAWNENNALTDEAAERYKTFESRLQIFKNILTDVAISIGNSVVPVLTDMMSIMQPIVQLLGFVLELFNKIPEPIRKTVVAALMLVAAIGPVLFIAGKMLSGLNGMADNLEKVGGAVTKVSGFFTTLNPTIYKTVGIILLVVAALAALGIIINSIMGRSNDLSNAFKSMGDSVNNIKMPAIPDYAVQGSHRSGLSRVPHDGYIAELHKDEEVLTASDPRNQNNRYRGASQQTQMESSNMNNAQFSEMMGRFDQMISTFDGMRQAYQDSRRFDRMGRVEA